MGKKIEDPNEKTDVQKVHEQQAPGATFLDKPVNVQTSSFVIKNEDPLFAMKRREQELRQKLLNNPVQMRKLREKVRLA